MSCNWATYPKVILYTLVYFSLNWIVSVIRIHDKYQSFILVGLALTEKASSRIQCILFHFRSYWRGWRPLVTPWAGCIKEGIEPRIFQKRFMPSHAQVRFPLCSLSLFSCSVSVFIVLIIIIIIIITMNIYLQRVFIIAVVMETNLDLIIAIVMNANLDILISKTSSLFYAFSLSLLSSPLSLC